MWVGGDHGLAVGLAIFYVVMAGVAYVWSRGDGDVAALLIDVRATAASGAALAAASLVGAVAEWRAAATDSHSSASAPSQGSATSRPSPGSNHAADVVARCRIGV